MRRIRDARQWSQTDLARECQLAGWDISRAVVAKIEGQTRWVGDFELTQLAGVLGVSPNDLVSW